jgi:hypothetical protein
MNETAVPVVVAAMRCWVAVQANRGSCVRDSNDNCSVFPELMLRCIIKKLLERDKEAMV